jgi:hypothetical protein
VSSRLALGEQVKFPPDLFWRVPAVFARPKKVRTASNLIKPLKIKDKMLGRIGIVLR